MAATKRKGFRSGQDVRIMSGETENIRFRGMDARVVRDEEPREGPDGKVEDRVVARPYLPDGRLGTPFCLASKRLRRPGAGGAVGFFFGKLTEAASRVVPLPFINPWADSGETQVRTPTAHPEGFASR